MLGVHVDRALGHEGARRADAGSFAQDAQLLRGASAHGAVAGDDDGPARRGDQLEGLVDDLVVGYRPAVAARSHRHRVHVVLGDVLGQLDQHRAGLLAARGAHRLAHDLGDGAGVVDGGGPLGDRPEHLDHVHDLVRFLVQSRRGALPGQHQHRRAIHVRIGHAGDEVGGARPEGGQTAGRVPGEPPVDLGHEGGTLLVAGQHEAHAVRALQRHHEIGVLLAGHTEDVLDALGLQTLDEQIRCFQRCSSLQGATSGQECLRRRSPGAARPVGTARPAAPTNLQR